MNAREEVRELIRAADGGTATALLRLAELLDEHVISCPHVEPPVARPQAWSEPWPETVQERAARIMAPLNAADARDYRPTSADEQVMVNRAASTLAARRMYDEARTAERLFPRGSGPLGGLMAHLAAQEARASVELDKGEGQTLIAEVSDVD